jgi:hypothetical protein
MKYIYTSSDLHKDKFDMSIAIKGKPIKLYPKHTVEANRCVSFEVRTSPIYIYIYKLKLSRKQAVEAIGVLSLSYEPSSTHKKVKLSL